MSPLLRSLGIEMSSVNTFVGFFTIEAASLSKYHSHGILNYCRTKVPFGVVEAINSHIKTLFRRGRGYKNLRYLPLKAQSMAVTKTEFIVLQKVA
jgi:hypothetical protein